MLLFTPAENEMEGKSPLSWDVSCQIPAEERGHLCYMEWKQLLPKKKKILDGEGNERSEDKNDGNRQGQEETETKRKSWSSWGDENICSSSSKKKKKKAEQCMSQDMEGNRKEEEEGKKKKKKNPNILKTTQRRQKQIFFCTKKTEK